jgi:hypothetical protein
MRHGHTRISTHSATNKNMKVLANYDKTRINMGHQHDRMELKEALRVLTHLDPYSLAEFFFPQQQT